MAQENNQTVNIKQYFLDDVSNDKDFFDEISRNADHHTSAMMTSVIASTSTQNLFDAAKTKLMGNEMSRLSIDNQTNVSDKTEPIVCKIFASDMEEGKSKTFFDMISTSSSQELMAKVDLYDPLQMESISEGPFPSPLKGFEDISSELFSVECDRSREAWIPSDATRKSLIVAATSPPGTYSPGPEILTLPGIVLEEDMVDNVTQLLRHHFGEFEANQRKVLTVNDVSQDEMGLRRLMQAECFRAAVNLTGRMLTNMYNQGANKQGHLSKHTAHSIQLWFTRSSLLVKLGAYQIADAEANIWWDFDKPDMYYQFYPELHGGKPGTMVPFQMRLLVATLPAFVKKYSEALNRIYSILSVIKQIITNLESGKSEDGNQIELNQKDREISRQVWQSREARVLHSIINVALMAKDYLLAIEVLQTIIAKTYSQNQKRSLQSSLGRIFLQLGDSINAEKCFNACKPLKQTSTGTLSINTPDLRELIDRGLLAIAQNSFKEAIDYFQKASLLDPSNVVILNNMAVCLLYMGQLKNALTLLTSAIKANPSLALHEALLLNVCTLFELESSRSEQNKLTLLKEVAKYRGDSINVACLKLAI